MALHDKIYFSFYLSGCSWHISHVAIRLSLHVCFLHILHKVFTLYIWFFFNLCPTPAKFDIHTWHLPLSSDIGGPTASPSTSHCLFLITNSIFCLTSVVRPFKLREKNQKSPVYKDHISFGEQTLQTNLRGPYQ